FIHYSLTTFLVYFFNDTATTEIYTLSLHDALPISARHRTQHRAGAGRRDGPCPKHAPQPPRPARLDCRPRLAARGRLPVLPRDRDRKSTRLNSSHVKISYAVFCLKKKIDNKRSRHT